MVDGDAFLRGVPKFLRRAAEPASEDPIFMTSRDREAPPPADIPNALQAPANAPDRRPGSLLSPQPVRAAPRSPQPVPAGDFFVEARGSIQDLFATTVQGRVDEEDDAAFQVTLPRGVIRQIRILAAQEGTTQRAIVLKALRLAGLAVPEGADIDRRILAGRRRQQA